MSLRISADLSLPLDVAGEAVGFLSTRGAGKSYASAVLVEEFFDAGVQVVVLDPTGVYWGLRGSGEQDGLPIYVFGGTHGDLPLEATAGGLLADLAVDQEQSFVLDLSGFDTKGEQTKFVAAFAERLYRRKAQNRETLVLVVDEADEFAPQRPMRDEPRMLGAMEAIVRRGRSRGLGVVLITQRSAAVNKNVLDLIETLFVMRTLGPRDRKAVQGWIEVHELADELGVLDSLPSLPTGTAWVWSPVRGILQQIGIRRIRTFDSYQTPKPGEARPEPKEIAPIDLGELGERMAATVEKAKANDPAELKREIRRLQAELVSRPTEDVVHEVEKVIEVPTPVFNGEIEIMEEQIGRVNEMISAPAEAIEKLKEAALTLGQAVAAAKGVTTLARTSTARPTPRVERAPRAPRPEPRPAHPASAPAATEDFSPTRPQQKILDALAWLASIGLEGDRLRVGFLSGYSPNSGNYQNLLGQLKTATLVHHPRPGVVELTLAGAALAQEPENAITTSQLHGKVLEKLRGPQQRVLEYLLSRYPEECSREEVAEATNYSANSGNFQNILGSLKTLGVIGRPAPGYVRAEDLLFLE